MVSAILRKKSNQVRRAHSTVLVTRRRSAKNSFFMWMRSHWRHLPNNFCRVAKLLCVAFCRAAQCGRTLKITWHAFLTQLLKYLLYSSEQPSSTVDMVKSAAVDSTEGAGCHCRVPWWRASFVQQWFYSHFQILMNSAVVTRLFHDVGAAGAAMDPAEGAGCRCRVPRCREPCVQQWILQSASAECCRAQCRVCSEKSRALFVLAYLEMQSIFFGADFTDSLAFTNRRPRTSRIRIFRITHAQVLLPFAVPQLAIKFGSSDKHHPNLYSCLKEFQKEQANCETSVMELDLGKSVKSAPKKWIAFQERVFSSNEKVGSHCKERRDCTKQYHSRHTGSVSSIDVGVVVWELQCHPVYASTNCTILLCSLNYQCGQM